jgi:hypothetical protein
VLRLCCDWQQRATGVSHGGTRRAWARVFLFLLISEEVDRSEADGPEDAPTNGWCCGFVGSSVGISWGRRDYSPSKGCT